MVVGEGAVSIMIHATQTSSATIFTILICLYLFQYSLQMD